MLLCLLACPEQGYTPCLLDILPLMKHFITTVDAGSCIYKITGSSELPVMFN